jgi:hypothetical protein
VSSISLLEAHVSDARLGMQETREKDKPKKPATTAAASASSAVAGSSSSLSSSSSAVREPVAGDSLSKNFLAQKMINTFIAKIRHKMARQRAEAASELAAREEEDWSRRAEKDAAEEAKYKSESASHSLRRPMYNALRYPVETAAIMRLLGRLRLLRDDSQKISIKVKKKKKERGIERLSWYTLSLLFTMLCLSFNIIIIIIISLSLFQWIPNNKC